MTTQVVIVLILTFVINLITTLSYSVRIVGIRTGRIAISFALQHISNKTVIVGGLVTMNCL